MSTNTILASAPLTSTGYHLKANGTTLGNSLIWDNGTNVGIGNTNTSYTLDVSGTGRFTGALTAASGNIVINADTTYATYSTIGFGGGTADGNNRIFASNTGASQLYIAGATGFGITFRVNGNSTNAVNISSAGNVGIGTSSPSQKLSIVGSYVRSHSLSEDNTSAGVYFQVKNGASTVGQSSQFVDNAGNLIVYTGTSSEAERMRITSIGNVFIGYSGGITDTRLLVISQGTTSSTYSIVIKNSSLTNLFYIRDDGAFFTGSAAASPYNNTTGTAANLIVLSDGSLARSTSSLKYKNNVENYTKGLAEVMQLRPVSYEGKNDIDNGKQFAGLIAEEVHELGLTEFVQYAEDGTPDALAYSNMIALLTKAIQEMNTKLDEQNQAIQNLQEQINILAK